MAKKLTGNQIVARYVLGHLPAGYVCCAQSYNTGAEYDVGTIYVDGRRVASVPASLHGGRLPSSVELAK